MKPRRRADDHRRARPAGLDTGVPVVFGVLTVETLDQALVSSADAADAADAAGVEGSQNVGAEVARVALEMIAIVASSRP